MVLIALTLVLPNVILAADAALPASKERDVGDFVLYRADGQYAYQIAVVVDDALGIAEMAGVTGGARDHGLGDDAAPALAAVADHTNGQLLVFETASREQVDAVDVGPGPHGVWAVPAG